MFVTGAVRSSSPVGINLNNPGLRKMPAAM